MLPGTVVAFLFLIQEVVGSNTTFFQKYITNSVDSTEFIKEKLDCLCALVWN